MLQAAKAHRGMAAKYIIDEHEQANKVFEMAGDGLLGPGDGGKVFNGLVLGITSALRRLEPPEDAKKASGGKSDHAKL